MSSVAASTPPDAPRSPGPGGSDAHRTLRNAGLVMASRVLHVAAATLFAILVPRVMGPPVFGRYALLTSVSQWFAQLSGTGIVSLITRMIPEFMASGDRAATEKLFTNLFVVRIGTAMAAAAMYSLIVLVWLDEPDVVAAALIAAALPARILGNLCFGLFLGLNQTVRWTAGELLQRWLMLALVLGGAVVGGLRGACAGFFLASLVVFLVGVASARHSLRWSCLDLSAKYLRPYLRLGTAFAAAQVLHTLSLRSGAVIVRLATGSYAQVGYVGAALAIYQTGGQAMWQLALSFTPFFVGRFHAGERHAVAGWLERMLALLVAGAVLVNFAVLFVGADVLPTLLGAAFAPVVASLAPMAVALVPFSFAAVGRIVALIVDRPRTAAVAAAIELVVAWTAGSALASWLGAPGAAAGMLVAVCAWAFAMSWPLRQELRYSIAPAMKAVALGAAFIPGALLRGSLPVNALLLAVSSGAYIALAVRLRIVSPRDVETLRQLMRRRSAATDRAVALRDDDD